MIDTKLYTAMDSFTVAATITQPASKFIRVPSILRCSTRAPNLNFPLKNGYLSDRTGKSRPEPKFFHTGIRPPNLKFQAHRSVICVAYQINMFVATPCHYCSCNDDMPPVECCWCPAISCWRAGLNFYHLPLKNSSTDLCQMNIESWWLYPKFWYA
jgi:hypothetical protein